MKMILFFVPANLDWVMKEARISISPLKPQEMGSLAPIYAFMSQKGIMAAMEGSQPGLLPSNVH